MHKEVIKALKRIIKASADIDLKRLLELNEMLITLSASSRVAYKQAIASDDWKPYDTLKEIKLQKLMELNELESRMIKEQKPCLEIKNGYPNQN